MALRVPLDYDDASVGIVATHFMKSPAEKKSNHPQDTLVNYGGPGGSGIEFMPSSIKGLRQKLGWEHNIASFDPHRLPAHRSCVPTSL
ncbi:hypothetical protein DPSP01_010051 [Paraphaeosphaeria sporulosa]